MSSSEGEKETPAGASAAAYMAQQEEATESDSEAMDVDETQEEEDATEQPSEDTGDEEEAPEPNVAKDENAPNEEPVTQDETLEEDVDDSQEEATRENTEVEKEAVDKTNGEPEADKTEDAGETRSLRSRDPPPEESAQQPAYSTRGRYQKEEDPLEALLAGVRAQGDEEREMVAPATTGTSFLESLNEEDRRTRTRHLPDVEGFHPLYKNEVKSDLALARSIVSSSGQSGSLSRRSKGKKAKDDNQMDVDDADGTGPSEDERASEVGGKVIELDHKEFPLPSKAFVAPKSVSDGSASIKPKKQVQSPFVSETLTAYNPPRPSESSSAKIKHRMLRWERRPQDIEGDLSNYRKTVRRTREELRDAEKERERIQMFGAILRVHFREQLDLLNEESHELNEELSAIQTECVSAADLLTSRTRSRGVGKGSYLMRDVIAVLRQRGMELAEKGLPALVEQGENTVPGLGGVTSFGFVDWDKKTDVPVQKLAIGWTLPGDNVSTPYGHGVALHVYGPSFLDVKEAVPADLRPKPAPTPSNGNKETTLSAVSNTESNGDGDVVMHTGDSDQEPSSENDKRNGATDDATDVPSSDPKAKENEENGRKANGGNKSAPEPAPSSESDAEKERRMDEILAPRICVKLPFGFGFFPVSEVKSMENTALYSDAQLASRWNKMIETSALVGSCLDVAGMESVSRASVVDRDYNVQSSMEVDDESEEDMASGTEAKVSSSDLLDKAKPHVPNSADTPVSSAERFVPYGASLLPTDAGRGSLISKAPLTALESPIEKSMFQAAGALGMPGNPGVPRPAHTWEEMRQESYTLQSKVLHLRNELHRQRRIRTLNERTAASFKERSLRAEALVTEMKADLKSLKDRLGDEVGELGIDRAKADSLLSSHYKAQENKDSDSAPPKKRTRRAIREAPQPPVLKTTRRRRANSATSSDLEGVQGITDSLEDAMFEEKMKGHCSDEERRATKRARQ
jgi:hypothetical protein